MIAALCALLATAALAGYGEIRAARPARAAADLITVSQQSPGQNPYQFQGFGVSLAWWANVVGGWSPAQRNQIEDALFGTSGLNNPNRLGLNVLRYNIGASPAAGNPPVADQSVLPSTCQPWAPGAAVPVVQPGPGQPINLGLDTNQIRVLTEAVSRLRTDGEQPVLEAFANSAPWWMTTSGCPQGLGTNAVTAGLNLDNTRIADYAQYLTSVVQAIRNQDGITFNTVDPLNEPDDPWFQGEHGQEGMTVALSQSPGSPGQQDLVIGSLCDALRSASLPTTVAAPDGFNPDGASSGVGPPDSTLGDIDHYVQQTKDCLTKINTHMYDFNLLNQQLNPYVGTGRRALAAAVSTLTPGQPKRLWVSEFGNGGAANDISAGTTLSTQITRDIRYLRPSAWVYWQAIEATGGWGLIEAPGGSSAPVQYPAEAALAPNFPNEIHSGFITPTKRFYAVEQYSRFIHPGDQIISASDPGRDNQSAEQASTVAAVDTTAGTLTIVTTNNSGSPRTPTYDISALAPSLATGNVQIYRTDGDVNVQPDAQPIQVTNGQFTDTQPAHSINTYVIGLPGLPGTGFPPNQPPVVSAGPDVSGNETAAIALHGSATDPDGDPLRIQWSAAQPTGTTDPGASCRFADPASPQTTVTCTDEGDYRVTLTADDGVNLPVSSSATVHVQDVGPSISITAPAQWQASRSPAAVRLTAPVTDPGVHDTHTCTINWDDGTPPETFAQEGSCDRNHTFTTPGIYTIQVTVTDDDGHSATASVIAVVFDPAAGLVAGDGWIDSQPGAYTPDPSASGKAFFSFEAFYREHVSTPVGDVAIRLRDSKLDLDETSLDWLVVSPDGEAAVKGSGTSFGQQVRFILYGYQGCGPAWNRDRAHDCQPGPDRFRAVIWPAASGANPAGSFIYDNVPSTDTELADASPQPLGGGNIQIRP